MKAEIISANRAYTAKVNALLDDLRQYPEDLLNKIPVDQGWSAIQTMHHLILVEEQSMAYLRKKLSYKPDLKTAGWLAAVKMLLLKISLISPIKFKAPRAASDLIPASDSLEAVKSRWLKIRQEWETFFTEMPDAWIDKAVYRHPRIGLINWIQTIDFLSSHFERHKGQIKRAIS